MRNPLSPEAALGFFVLLVSFPIAATLIYIFGVSIADAVNHPSEYWLVWVYAVAWGLSGIRMAIRHYKRSHSTSANEVVN